MPERTIKDPSKLYYSISEVAELANVKPHVLRYWETQFKMLHPRKNRAGNRSYRAKEVQLALRIKRLLYEEGFTIAGARRKLLDERRSGQSQTELHFVGLSQGEFLGVLRRDLESLLRMVRGEVPLADVEQPLAGSSDVANDGRGNALLGEVDEIAADNVETDGVIDIAETDDMAETEDTADNAETDRSTIATTAPVDQREQGTFDSPAVSDGRPSAAPSRAAD